MSYKQFVGIQNLLNAIKTVRENRQYMNQKEKEDIFQRIMKNVRNAQEKRGST